MRWLGGSVGGISGSRSRIAAMRCAGMLPCQPPHPPPHPTPPPSPQPLRHPHPHPHIDPHPKFLMQPERLRVRGDVCGGGRLPRARPLCPGPRHGTRHHLHRWVVFFVVVCCSVVGGEGRGAGVRWVAAGAGFSGLEVLQLAMACHHRRDAPRDAPMHPCHVSLALQHQRLAGTPHLGTRLLLPHPTRNPTHPPHPIPSHPQHHPIPRQPLRLCVCVQMRLTAWAAFGEGPRATTSAIRLSTRCSRRWMGSTRIPRWVGLSG